MRLELKTIVLGSPLILCVTPLCVSPQKPSKKSSSKLRTSRSPTSRNYFFRQRCNGFRLVQLPWTQRASPTADELSMDEIIRDQVALLREPNDGILSIGIKRFSCRQSWPRNRERLPLSPQLDQGLLVAPREVQLRNSTDVCGWLVHRERYVIRAGCLKWVHFGPIQWTARDFLVLNLIVRVCLNYVGRSDGQRRST